MKHREITVIYRQRDGYWQASSPDVPDLVAGDRSLPDVQALAHGALRDVVPGDLRIVDVVEESAGIG